MCRGRAGTANYRGKEGHQFMVDNTELEVEPDTTSNNNNVQVVKPSEKATAEPDLKTNNNNNKCKQPCQNIIWKRVPHTGAVGNKIIVGG